MGHDKKCRVSKALLKHAAVAFGEPKVGKKLLN